MSKKKSFFLTYSIFVNQEEYAREFTVKGARNKAHAEKQLRAMCSTEIIITSNTEIL